MMNWTDFNWGPGGPNGFAAPGLWADAAPVEHLAWYGQLGCNVIQTFAVSCNGYAWYKDGVVPELVAPASSSFVVEGANGPGAGKHIVLVSGDEEYRSEESLPMLAPILAGRHGFKCTVLFAVNQQTGEIDPNTVDNIPGLEALAGADLMVVCTRFRQLPDEQMKFKYSSDNHGPYPTARGSARVFMTTLGASQDFERESFRRMVVNACFWTLGLEDRILPKTNVELVGTYAPRPFGFNTSRRGLTPAMLAEEARRAMARMRE